jgi:hypothetical protein
VSKTDLPGRAVIIVWTKKRIEAVERLAGQSADRCNLGSQISGVLAVRRIGNADFGTAGFSGLSKPGALA